MIEGQESRACHICGIAGHLMKDCPKRRGAAALPLVRGQYVTLADFPSDWESKSTEDLTAQLAEELEVFGTLTLAPILIDGHRKAVGAFEEEEAAKAAIDALQSIITIELRDPPTQNVADGKPGSILIQDFPARWQASDIGALLHGTVKPSSLVSAGLKHEGALMSSCCISVSTCVPLAFFCVLLDTRPGCLLVQASKWYQGPVRAKAATVVGRVCGCATSAQQEKLQRSKCIDA